tara:strand:- start:159 stop:434 length:276 start_codon:yes stop_codon:yes gene_type:complete
MNVLTGDAILTFRLLTMRQGLKLEDETNGGMRLTGKGRTCYAMVKREYGFKGNRNKVLYQLESYIRKQYPNHADKSLELNAENKSVTYKGR